MIRDRLIELFNVLEVSSRDMEKATGIDRNKWSNIRGGKQRANEEHIEAVCDVYPQFALWIVSGRTIPEAGQISPEIEKARKENSLKTG